MLLTDEQIKTMHPAFSTYIYGRVQIQMAILGHLPILTLECCHTPGAEYN